MDEHLVSNIVSLKALLHTSSGSKLMYLEEIFYFPIFQYTYIKETFNLNVEQFVIYFYLFLLHFTFKIPTL